MNSSITREMNNDASNSCCKLETINIMPIVAVSGRNTRLFNGYVDTKNYPKDLVDVPRKINVAETIPSVGFSTWSLNDLIDHIINQHHKYCKVNAILIHDLARE